MSICKHCGSEYETDQTAFPFGSGGTEQRTKVLNALMRARSAGVTNVDLNKICFRYSARIWELREEGYKIEKQQISAKVFKYTLAPESW